MSATIFKMMMVGWLLATPQDSAPPIVSAPRPADVTKQDENANSPQSGKQRTSSSDQSFRARLSPAAAGQAGQSLQPAVPPAIPQSSAPQSVLPNASPVAPRFSEAPQQDFSSIPVKVAQPQRGATEDRIPTNGDLHSVLQTDLQSPEPQTDDSAASRLIRHIRAQIVADNPDAGALSILELVRQVPHYQRREAIASYWRCLEAHAGVWCAQQEWQWYQQLLETPAYSRNPLLNAARSVASDRVAEAQLRRIAAARAMDRYFNPPPEMTVPTSLPLVGPYRTEFELYQSNRPMRGDLQQIHVTLPLRQQQIGRQAETVELCQEAIEQTFAGLAAAQVSAHDAIEAVRIWRESGTAFITSVVQYNLAINDYALTVAPAAQSAEQVVGMLVRQDQIELHDSLTQESQIRQAGLESNESRLPPSGNFQTVPTPTDQSPTVSPALPPRLPAERSAWSPGPAATPTGGR